MVVILRTFALGLLSSSLVFNNFSAVSAYNQWYQNLQNDIQNRNLFLVKAGLSSTVYTNQLTSEHKNNLITLAKQQKDNEEANKPNNAAYVRAVLMSRLASFFILAGASSGQGGVLAYLATQDRTPEIMSTVARLSIIILSGTALLFQLTNHVMIRPSIQAALPALQIYELIEKTVRTRN